MPTSLEEAYRIQDEAVALMGEPVAGWKVAPIAAELRDRFGAARIAGPAFRAWNGTRGNPEVPVFPRGYCAGEAELQLRIGSMPLGPDPSLEEAIDAIDRICIGIEVAGSPFADINRHGPAVTISDFGNNIGLVIGQEIVGRQASKLREPAVTSRINGETVGKGALSDLLSGPFAAAQFLFSFAAQRPMDVRPGQWISSGAVTGAHPVRPGDCFEAEFDEFGLVACKFIVA